MLPAGSRFDPTPREREILELVAYGYPAKKIARRLKIAPRTAERHIENLRLKMGARNRAHVVTLAALSGALRIPSTSTPRRCSECLFRPPLDVDDVSAPKEGPNNRRH